MPGDEPVGDVGSLFEDGRPDDQFGLERRIGVRMILGMTAAGADEPAVGRYRIERKIGEGAMGAVYRAVDPELERTVALKVMRVLTGQTQRKLMLREAKALASLAHPNVVAVHDIGTADGQMYVTMEYIEGGTMRSWLDEPTPRSWREFLAIFLDAGKGLAAAHQVGIIHRDFKPENVLIGTDGRVRVVDFGFARRVVRPGGKPGTDPATVAGTPAYMAPETMAGKPATAHSDQYAFCRALGEALGLRREHSVGHGEPDALWEAVNRGLHPEPEQRHRDMKSLLTALERVLVAPVFDDRREALISRIESVLGDAEATTTLVRGANIRLTLEEAPEHVPTAAVGLLESWGAERLDDTAHLAQVFERAGGSLLVLGRPGSGKSTALRDLAGVLLDRARRDTSLPIPVLLNLSSFAEFAGPMESWLAMEVMARYGIPERQTRARLVAEAWVLVLDGLDEVGPEAVDACVRGIGELRRRFPCPLVVGSRETDYAAAAERLDLRGAVRIAPLTPDQTQALLRGLGDEDPGRSAELIPEPEKMAELSTPLLVSLAATCRAEVDETTPSDRLRERLYTSFVRRALGDTSAGRGRCLSDGLRWIARSMSRRSLSELWIERLDPGWTPSRATRWAALAVGLSWLAVVMVGGVLLATIVAGRERQVAWILGPGVFPLVLLFNRGLGIRPVDELRWSWRRSLRWLPIAMGGAMAVGALYGMFYVLWFNVVAGALAGLVVALPLGLESSEEVVGLEPNRAIRSSATNALMVGGATGLVAGFVMGPGLLWLCLPYLGPESEFHYMAHPYWASFWVSAAVVGIPAGLAAGGTAAILHAATRVVLAATTPLPLRLVPFLESGVRCGLLRRVGGGYVFPHRTLLDHLADPDTDPETG